MNLFYIRKNVIPQKRTIILNNYWILFDSLYRKNTFWMCMSDLLVLELYENKI